MKDFGSLFSQTLKEYGDKFVPVLKVFLLFYLLPTVVFAILAFVSFLAFFGPVILSDNFPQVLTSPLSTNGGFGNLIGLSIGFVGVIFILCLALTVFIVFMSLSYLYIGFSGKRDMTMKEIFNEGIKKYFWKYSGFVLVSGILLALMFIVIVPGIIFLVYWIFGVYILIKENKGVMDSLKKSKEIVKGNWWTVFAFFLLVGVISAAVSIAVGWIPLIRRAVAPLVITPFAIFFFKNMYLDMASKRKAGSEKKPRARRKRKS